MPDSLDLLTLLAVRLRSRGTSDAIAITVGDLTGRNVDAAVMASLETAVELEQVRRRGDEGRHSLTPAGDAELAALLAADLDGPSRAEITTAYEAFLPLNRRFLAACVGWQDDPAEIDEFDELIDALAVVLDALTVVRARFGSYGPRLAAARSEAAVDPRWIDSPTRDSVHTVWFELHEHLLATLGRRRTDEPAS